MAKRSFWRLMACPSKEKKKKPKSDGRVSRRPLAVRQQQPARLPQHQPTIDRFCKRWERHEDGYYFSHRRNST
jgi:hypothetical protein